MTRPEAIRVKGLKHHLDGLVENGYNTYKAFRQAKASNKAIARYFKKHEKTVRGWNIIDEEENAPHRPV